MVVYSQPEIENNLCPKKSNQEHKDSYGDIFPRPKQENYSKIAYL